MHQPYFTLGGWLQGSGTYLWFGEEDRLDENGKTVYGPGYAILDGPSLHRLAKAIVRHFAMERKK